MRREQKNRYSYRLDPNIFDAAFHGMRLQKAHWYSFQLIHSCLFLRVKIFKYGSECKRSLRRGRLQAKKDAVENNKTKKERERERRANAMGIKVWRKKTF